MLACESLRCVMNVHPGVGYEPQIRVEYHSASSRPRPTCVVDVLIDRSQGKSTNISTRVKVFTVSGRGAPGKMRETRGREQSRDARCWHRLQQTVLSRPPGRSQFLPMQNREVGQKQLGWS